MTKTKKNKIATSEEKQPKAARDSGRKFAWFLWGGALVSLGLAATLPFAERLSWRMEQIANALDSAGLQPGVLFLAGLVFVALALVVHGVRSATAMTKSATERVAFLADEMLTQMALVRTGQNQGQTMQEDLRQVLARVGAEVAAMGTQEGEASSDALFRLAASVDQLSARVDERFNSMTERVEDRLDEFSHELERHDGPEPAAAWPTAAAAPAAAMATPSAFEPDPSEDSGLQGEPNPFEAIDLEHQPAMEFLDSMEEAVEGSVQGGELAHDDTEIVLDLDVADGPFMLEDGRDDRQSA